MFRTSLIVLAACFLTACGLAETASTAATGAATEAEQARQAQQTERQVQERVQAAAEQDAERRRAAEAGDAN
jgi:hypothetical protein